MSNVYVDQSNVFAEGCFVSAVRKGWAQDIWDAHERGVRDHHFTVDFHRLYRITGASPSGIARLYSSRTYANDRVWHFARQAGFATRVFARNRAGKEKQVDGQLIVDALTDAALATPTPVVLVAGDEDYVPLVRRLRELGREVRVMFWSHASRALRDAASSFTPMDHWLDTLRVAA